MAEPKGVRNEKGQFVKGAYFGRKGVKFETPEEMEVKIEEYFDKCDNRIVKKYDRKQQTVVEVNIPVPYTLIGLSNHLGLSYETFLRYGEKNPFSETLMRAREKVMQNQVEGAILGDFSEKTIHLMLKNYHGLVEKKEVDVKTELPLQIIMPPNE